MSLVLTTDYVTFYIHKKNDKHPVISHKFGFRLISGESTLDINYSRYEQFLSYGSIVVTIGEIPWTLTDTDDKDVCYSSYLLKTIIPDNMIDGDRYKIDLPETLENIVSIRMFNDFDLGKFLGVTLLDSDYTIDYELHKDKIKEQGLNIDYESNVKDKEEEKKEVDWVDGWDDGMCVDMMPFYQPDFVELKPLNIKLDSAEFTFTGIHEFINKHSISNTGNSKTEIYEIDVNDNTFDTVIDTLKFICIQYNISNPTPDQKISLYDLIAYSLRIKEQTNIEIGKYLININCKYSLLKINIKITINNTI